MSGYCQDILVSYQDILGYCASFLRRIFSKYFHLSSSLLTMSSWRYWIQSLPTLCLRVGEEEGTWGGGGGGIMMEKEERAILPWLVRRLVWDWFWDYGIETHHRLPMEMAIESGIWYVTLCGRFSHFHTLVLILRCDHGM